MRILAGDIERAPVGERERVCVWYRADAIKVEDLKLPGRIVCAADKELSLSLSLPSRLFSSAAPRLGPFVRSGALNAPQPEAQSARAREKPVGAN